ncbi:MAG: tol-pal system protein YbgF [Halioglobus sp.]|nr:tol-pal system protein YbgF [Halioglobus sp.]
MSKVLVKCGLVVLAALLSFLASAQYVDLEAERAAAQAAGGTANAPVAQSTGSGAALNAPYGARPAQAYPAANYGASTAPAEANAVTYPADSTTPAAVAGSQVGGTDLRNLFLQMQQLQQEVRRLNGKVEEQSFELRSLKEQSLQRYMDLDKRVSGASGQPDTAAPTSTPVTAASGVTSNLAAGAEEPGEVSAYRAAYALVQGRQFDKAIPAFQQFLQRFPGGLYAANAHYWLGELYLVKQPPDLEASRQSFVLLLAEYPDNSKAPDALYKLGKVQFMKGNREKAREYMDLVISQYGSTNNAVVKLAREFIAQNF